MLIGHGVRCGPLLQRSNLQLSTRLTLACSSSLSRAWVRPSTRPLYTPRMRRRLCCRAAQRNQSAIPQSNEHRNISVRIRIAEGDTLQSLAEESGFSETTLQAANGGESELEPEDLLEFTSEVPEGMEVVTNSKTFRLEKANTDSLDTSAQDGSNMFSGPSPLRRVNKEDQLKDYEGNYEQEEQLKHDPGQALDKLNEEMIEGLPKRIMQTARYVGVAGCQVFLVGACAILAWNAFKLNLGEEEAADRAERRRNQGRAVEGPGPLGSRLENPRVRAEMERRHGRSFLEHLDAEAIADEAEEVYQQQQQLRQVSNPTPTFTGNGSDALHRDTVLQRPIMGTSNPSSVDASKAAQRDKALRQQAANARGRFAVNGTSASDSTAQRDNAFAAQTQQQQQSQQQQQASSASTVSGISEDKQHAFGAFLSRIMGIVSNAKAAASTSAPVDVTSQQQEPKQSVVAESELDSDTSATVNVTPKHQIVPEHEPASSTSAPTGTDSQRPESKQQSVPKPRRGSSTPATIFVDSPQHGAEQEGLPSSVSNSEASTSKGTEMKSQELQRPSLSRQQYSQQLFREAEFTDSMPDAAVESDSASASAAPSSAALEDSEPSTSEPASSSPSSAAAASASSPASASPTPSSAAAEDPDLSTSGRDSLKEAAESDMTHPPSPVKSQSASPQRASTAGDLHTSSSQTPSTSADSPQKQTKRSSRLDQTDSETSGPTISASDMRNESKGTSSSSPQHQQSSKGTCKDESKPDWAELPLPEDEPWYRPQPQQPPKPSKGSTGPAPKPHWAEREVVFFATNSEGFPMNFHVDGQPEESEASLLLFEDHRDLRMLMDKIRSGMGEDLKWMAASPVSMMQECEACNRPIAWFRKGVVGATREIEDELEWVVELSLLAQVSDPSQLRDILAARPHLVAKEEEKRKEIRRLENSGFEEDEEVPDPDPTVSDAEVAKRLREMMPSAARAMMDQTFAAAKWAAEEGDEDEEEDESDEEEDESDDEDEPFSSTDRGRAAGGRADGNSPSTASGNRAVGGRADASSFSVAAGNRPTTFNSNGSSAQAGVNGSRNSTGISTKQSVDANGNGSETSQNGSSSGNVRHDDGMSQVREQTLVEAQLSAVGGATNGASAPSSARASAPSDTRAEASHGARAKSGNGAAASKVRKSAYAAMTKRPAVPLSQDVIRRMDQTTTAQPSSASAQVPWHNSPPGRSNHLSTESVDGRQPVTVTASATMVVDRPQSATVPPSVLNRKQSTTIMVDRPQSATELPSVSAGRLSSQPAATWNDDETQQSQRGSNQSAGVAARAQNASQQTASVQEARAPVSESSSSSSLATSSSSVTARASHSQQSDAQHSHQSRQPSAISHAEVIANDENVYDHDHNDSDEDEEELLAALEARETARMQEMLSAVREVSSEGPDSQDELSDSEARAQADWERSHVARNEAQLDALLAKYQESSLHDDRPPPDYWHDLKFVCLPEIHYPDGTTGLMTTDMASEASKQDPHLIAFASRDDAMEAQYLLQANAANQAGAQVRVRPMLPGQLQQQAKDSGHGVTVFAPGQLALIPGMTMEQLAKAIELA